VGKYRSLSQKSVSNGLFILSDELISSLLLALPSSRSASPPWPNLSYRYHPFPHCSPLLPGGQDAPPRRRRKRPIVNAHHSVPTPLRCRKHSGRVSHFLGLRLPLSPRSCLGRTPATITWRCRGDGSRCRRFVGRRPPEDGRRRWWELFSGGVKEARAAHSICVAVPRAPYIRHSGQELLFWFTIWVNRWR
jgi:hypothetical protein